MRSPSTLRRLLAVAEREIDELTVKRDVLLEQLAGADHQQAAAVSIDLATVDGQLAEAEERWLALGAELEDAQ